MRTSRRILVSSALAMPGLPLSSLARAQVTAGTPPGADASPVASPIATTQAPPTLGEVLPAYTDRSEALTALGREAVDAFLAGDDAALSVLLVPEAAALIASSSTTTLIEQLETNRLSFELPIVSGYFDAQYTGEQEMQGFYTQGTPSTFTLRTDEPQLPDAPAGMWEGEIGGALSIRVTFAGTADALTAALDVPDQGITAAALENVVLVASRPIGERQAERSLAIGGPGENYAATFAWGEASLLFLIVPDSSGKVAGFTIAPQYPLPDDPVAGYESPVTYRLPFDGLWFTFWGGPTELQNYHATTPGQRHAYDLVVWKDGATFSGDGSRNEDYYAWGQPVLAPADGTAVSVENRMPDMKPGELIAQMDPAVAEGLHPAGNHVIIETAENEYVLLAHMQEGSVRVRAGDRVAAGDPLGLTGNSGNTSESHIHIHAQDQPAFFAGSAVGLPLRFSGYRANGEHVDSGIPIQGEFIEP